jgi:hypothetical protein
MRQKHAVVNALGSKRKGRTHSSNSSVHSNSEPMEVAPPEVYVEDAPLFQVSCTVSPSHRSAHVCLTLFGSTCRRVTLYTQTCNSLRPLASCTKHLLEWMELQAREQDLALVPPGA